MSLLLVAMVVACPLTVLAAEIYEQEQHHLGLAGSLGTRLEWPYSIQASSPEDTYRILAQTAQETGSNVLRASVETGESGRMSIIYSLYMGAPDTQLFHRLGLREGRWPTAQGLEEQTEVATTLEAASPASSPRSTSTASRSASATASATATSTAASTAASTVSATVGAPSVLAGRYDVTVEGLAASYARLPAHGLYTIEAPSPEASDQFLQVAARRLSALGRYSFSVEDLIPQDGAGTAGVIEATDSSASPSASQVMSALPYLLMSLAVLLVPAVVLRSARHIGVLALHGLSTTRMWYAALGRMLLTVLAAGAAMSLVTGLVVPGADGPLRASLASHFLALAAVVLTLAYGLGAAAVTRIKVADLVKNAL